MTKKPYSKQDTKDVSYNPVLTAKRLKQAKPFAEVFPDLVKNKRGRPPQAVTKTQVTLRLDPKVIDYFKADGPGWQSRIDEALKKVAKVKLGLLSLRDAGWLACPSTWSSD